MSSTNGMTKRRRDHHISRSSSSGNDNAHDGVMGHDIANFDGDDEQQSNAFSVVVTKATTFRVTRNTDSGQINIGMVEKHGPPSNTMDQGRSFAGRRPTETSVATATTVLRQPPTHKDNLVLPLNRHSTSSQDQVVVSSLSAARSTAPPRRRHHGDGSIGDSTGPTATTRRQGAKDIDANVTKRSKSSNNSHGRPKRTPTTMRVDVDALHDHAAFCNMLEQYLPQFGPSTKQAIVTVFMSRFVLRQKQQCVPDTTTPNADQSKCKTFAWKRLDGRVARGIISRALTEAQEDWALAEATAKMLCGIMPMQSPRHDKYETYNDSGRDSPSDTPNKNAELENQLERAGRRLERRQPGPGRNKCGDIDGRQLVPPPPLSVSSHQKRKAGVCDWDEFGSGRKDEEEECTCEVTKRRPKTRAKTKQWSSSSSSAGAVVALRNVSPDLDIALPGVNGTSGSQTQQAATAVGRDHDHAPKKIDMNEIIVV